MPLSLAKLEELRDENLADDLDIDLDRMCLWSEKAASEYFESAGTLDPTPVPNLLCNAQLQLPANTPVRAWSCVVPTKWLDYNGHLTDAFYGVAFADATFAVLAHLGLGQRHNFFVKQAFTRHKGEVHAGDTIVADTIVLGVDRDRGALRLFHELSVTDGRAGTTTQEVLLLHVSHGVDRELAPCALSEHQVQRARDVGRSQKAASLTPKHIGRGVRGVLKDANVTPSERQIGRIGRISVGAIRTREAEAQGVDVTHPRVPAGWAHFATPESDGVLKEEYCTTMCCTAEHHALVAIGWDVSELERADGGTFYAVESCVWHEMRPAVAAGTPMRTTSRVLAVDSVRIHLLHQLFTDNAATTLVATFEQVCVYMRNGSGDEARTMTSMGEKLLENAQKMCEDHEWLPRIDVEGVTIGAGIEDVGL